MGELPADGNFSQCSRSHGIYFRYIAYSLRMYGWMLAAGVCASGADGPLAHACHTDAATSGGHRGRGEGRPLPQFRLNLEFLAGLLQPQRKLRPKRKKASQTLPRCSHEIIWLSNLTRAVPRSALKWGGWVRFTRNSERPLLALLAL